MNNNIFTHLHLHTDNSPLDGLGTISEYVSRAVDMGFQSIGCTDHGNVDGAIDFQKECDKASLNPITGAELYLCQDLSIKNKTSKYGHISIWCENISGWEALCRLITKANIDGFYRKPRIDYESILNEDISGLIFGTACAGSFLWLDGADEFMRNLIDKRGKDGVFIEIMPHDIDKQRELHNIYKTLYSDVYKIATNDAHYVMRRDAELHEILLAIASNKKWSDPNRWKFPIQTLYLCSATEMVRWFKEQDQFSKKEVLEAMDNTNIIAERCKNFRIKQKEFTLPKPPYELKGLTEEEHLKKMCREGMDKFGFTGNKIYEDRLKEELDLIIKKGYTRYFLIVQDLLSWCHKEGIGVGCARGSAGGSLLAYLIGITEGVEPIKYELLFSRFLNETRCFVSGTMIKTKNGDIPIQELKIGDSVYNKNGHLDTVKDTYNYMCDTELIRIHFDGRYVTCTKNHKWIVCDENGRILEKRADKIIAGRDKLLRVVDKDMS